MQAVESAALKAQMVARLRRVEGQVRGVQKMVEETRDCREIIQQLTAASAALQNATDLFLRAYAKECLLGMETTQLQEREATIETLLDLLIKARS